MSGIPYCTIHELIYAGSPVCPACAAVERHNTLDMLKAQIDDQGQQIADLSRKVSALEHQHQHDQRAHNALVRLVEDLDVRMGQALAHTRPNPDLLP